MAADLCPGIIGKSDIPSSVSSGNDKRIILGFFSGLLLSFSERFFSGSLKICAGIFYRMTQNIFLSIDNDGFSGGGSDINSCKIFHIFKSETGSLNEENYVHALGSD
jgi:hypothetical protein